MTKSKATEVMARIIKERIYSNAHINPITQQMCEDDARLMLTALLPHICDMVEKCRICHGYGNLDTIEYGGVGGQAKCWKCSGKGIVLKGEMK